MRKLSLLSTMLVIGLVVGLAGSAFVVDTIAANDNTSASWNNGSSGTCRIDFTAHAGVDLNPTGGETAPYSFGTVLENTGNTMSVNNNCKNGVAVEVKVASVTTPTDFDGNVLDDFQWKASTSHPKFELAANAGTYGDFTDIGTASSVGSSSNPASFSFSTSYRYTIDNQDIGGDYSVNLEYTVSSS